MGSSGENHGSGGSDERTESARLSDVGSHGEAGDVVDGSQSFSFGPSTVAIRQIRGMIDISYFTEGMGHKP
jgi:hypothetical protein